jgi:hypothetical protein
MSYDRGRRHEDTAQDPSETPAPIGWPGKRSLTQFLVQRKARADLSTA